MLRVRVLILLILSPILTRVQSIASTNDLVVSPSRGTAPFTITLTVPERFRDVVRKNCSELNLNRFAGVAYHVEWGDGKIFSDRSSDDASCGLSHVYTVPGTYKIKARIVSFTDCCLPPFSRTLWSDSARVTVNGIPQLPSLIILTPGAGERLPYQSVPQVKLKIAVNRKSDLVIELITNTGVIVATSKVKGLSFIDERTWTPQAQDWRIFDSILVNGTATAHVRVRLLQDGIPIITRESPDVTLTSVSREYSVIIENGSGPAPLVTTMHIPFINPNQECWRYRVDWGDGSPIDQSESRGLSNACSPFAYSKAEKILTHTYTTAGSYTITAESNAPQFNTPLDRFVPVASHEITVQ